MQLSGLSPPHAIHPHAIQRSQCFTLAQPVLMQLSGLSPSHAIHPHAIQRSQCFTFDQELVHLALKVRVVINHA